MKIKLDDAFITLFPETVVGIVYGHGTVVRTEFQDLLSAFRANAMSALRAKLGSEGDQQHENIEAWRDAYRLFGVNPKKHRPTHESLARRLMRDGHWPTINPIVDLYLANQAEFLLPHGGYDCARILWPICLSRSPGNEIFEPLGGGQEATDPDEVVYRDGNRVLTRRWNCRDCDSTRITESTSEFVLMIESPSARIPCAVVDAAAAGLAQKCRLAFNGEFSHTLLEAHPGEIKPNLSVI